MLSKFMLCILFLLLLHILSISRRSLKKYFLQHNKSSYFSLVGPGAFSRFSLPVAYIISFILGISSSTSILYRMHYIRLPGVFSYSYNLILSVVICPRSSGASLQGMYSESLYQLLSISHSSKCLFFMNRLSISSPASSILLFLSIPNLLFSSVLNFLS